MNSDRITTPFGAQSTAAEVIAGIDLTGKRAIITGGGSGIGVETARALAGAGAEVTLAVRNVEAGVRTAKDIVAGTGNKQVLVSPLDLADPASVAAFTANWDGPLDLLVNNAGVMALPHLQLTPAGWEMQLATNHLGHFALANGLREALAAAGNARIVSLSSRAHLRSPFEDCREAPVLDPGASETSHSGVAATPSTPKPPPACGSSRPPSWPATPRPASRSRAGACRVVRDSRRASVPPGRSTRRRPWPQYCRRESRSAGRDRTTLETEACPIPIPCGSPCW